MSGKVIAPPAERSLRSDSTPLIPSENGFHCGDCPTACTRRACIGINSQPRHSRHIATVGTVPQNTTTRPGELGRKLMPNFLQTLVVFRLAAAAFKPVRPCPSASGRERAKPVPEAFLARSERPRQADAGGTRVCPGALRKIREKNRTAESPAKAAAPLPVVTLAPVDP